MDIYATSPALLAVLMGAAGIFGVELKPTPAEPPLETKRIRLVGVCAICVAVQHVGPCS